jgi:hypothetical protein
MTFWQAIIHSLITEYSLLTTRDFIEISFFIFLASYWLRWLNTDKGKNLALLFCGYSLLTYGSYYIELTTISTLLLICAPLAAIILLFLHQEQLQRNFISATRHAITTTNTIAWLAEFMSFALNTLHKKHDMVYIIERTHNLNILLTSPCTINAVATKELLDLLISQGTPTAMNLWLSHGGIIIGMNALLNEKALENLTVTAEVKGLPRWQREALIITHKSDALILHGSSQHNSFDVVIEGKIIEHMSAQQTMVLLQRVLTLSVEQKGAAHESISSQRSVDQLHH